MNDRIFRNNFLQFQLATGVTKDIYFSRIYPTLDHYLTAAVNASHISRLDTADDVKQNILIKSLRRFQSIDISAVKSCKNFFFIMFKRLCINEAQIIKRRNKRMQEFTDAKAAIINNLSLLVDSNDNEEEAG